MSEWIEIKSLEDIELSEDGKHIEVLYNTNMWGNQYIEIPVEFITNALKLPNGRPEL